MLMMEVGSVQCDVGTGDQLPECQEVWSVFSVLGDDD